MTLGVVARVEPVITNRQEFPREIVEVVDLDIIFKGIGVGENQRNRLRSESLLEDRWRLEQREEDVVVELVHQYLRQVEDGNAAVDWTVELRDFLLREDHTKVLVAVVRRVAIRWTSSLPCLWSVIVTSVQRYNGNFFGCRKGTPQWCNLCCNETCNSRSL